MSEVEQQIESQQPTVPPRDQMDPLADAQDPSPADQAELPVDPTTDDAEPAVPVAPAIATDEVKMVKNAEGILCIDVVKMIRKLIAMT